MIREDVELAAWLRRVAEREEPGLSAIPDAAAGAAAPGRWSRKQELGHLVDSAANNRLRFIRAALEGGYSGPSYDGRGWVEMGGYAAMPWNDLVALWKALNVALAFLVERIPEERLQVTCSIGQSPSATLGFVLNDYILHMQHHLDHILEREHLTSYPSAAGVAGR